MSVQNIPTKQEMSGANYISIINKKLDWNVDNKFGGDILEKCAVLKNFFLDQEEGEHVVIVHTTNVVRKSRLYCYEKGSNCKQNKKENKKGKVYCLMTNKGRTISWKKDNTWNVVYNVVYKKFGK